MARTSKPLRPLDLAISQVLAESVDQSGMTRRQLAEETGVSANRIGMILRAEGPPSVGEVGVLAKAVGLSASAVMEEAERRAQRADASEGTVITGRFGAMGSAQTFAANAAALHSRISIFDAAAATEEMP